MTATLLHAPAPVVVSRRYIRDGRGRFAETPDGGIFDADFYQSAYGDVYDDRTGSDEIGMVSVRVFEDGSAHLVVDHNEEDDGIDKHEVLVEFDDPADMRRVAHELRWAATVDVPADADADVYDYSDLGNGWAVAVDGAGNVGIHEVDENGDLADAAADMSQDQAYELAEAIFEMANAAEDAAEDDDGIEWVVGDDEPGPSATAARRTRRAPRGKYNPGQKRDDDGQWSDGIPGDKLKLAKRIQLGDGEVLRASRKLPVDGNSETVPLGAAISTQTGPEVRLGIVYHDDERKWSAANLGGTLKLRPADVERISAAFEAEGVVAKARRVEIKKHWSEMERLEDARDEGPLNDAQAARLAELAEWDDRMRGFNGHSSEIDDIISEGTIPAGEWGDLAYQMWGVEDGEAGWRFEIAVRPADAVGWTFPNNDELGLSQEYPALMADLGASDMPRFLRHLNDLVVKASPEPENAVPAGVAEDTFAAAAAQAMPLVENNPGTAPPRNNAADTATGAMVALIPTDADAARLAVDGGEPVGELHLTLWYLGDAAAISAETRTALVTAVRSMVERRELPPVEARVFGADLWNADSDKPAWVLGVGDLPADERPTGQDTLAVYRETMSEAWHDGGIALDVPPQHTPWQPHICVAYSADPALLKDLVARLGPVTFDRIRVAFAGDAVDIPLAAPGKPTAPPGEPALGPSNTTAKTRPAANRRRLLPIRAFTEPINHKGGRPVGARTEARAARTRLRVQAKRKWFRIENKAGVADIYLYGEVGYFGVTAADFCEELRQVKASTINLHINSPGGQVHEGVAIYGALREHHATINVTIDGMAASAASFIACAGDRITIMRYAQMMIHEAWSDAYGNAEQLRKQADLLERTSATIAAIYSQRAGGDAETWRGLMKAETWFNADEAVQFGLADDIGGDVLAPARPVKSAWDLSVFAFAGRDRAPTPVLMPVAMAVAVTDGPELDGTPADVAETAPAEAADTEPVAEHDAELAGEAPDTGTGTPDAEPAPEPTTPVTAPSATWAAPAWTTTPADPWRSLVSGLTTPEPSTPDDPTAQEATK
jgi:ATP-dependent protease ClpP protease subunit